MNKKSYSSGFTVIEIIVITLIFTILAVLFITQFNNLQAKNRDATRKTAINSMYYTLEEVHFRNHNYYPTKLTTENMSSVPEPLLKDRNDIMVGHEGSEYRYEPTDCLDDRCSSYTLRVELEKEADFIKKSRN